MRSAMNNLYERQGGVKSVQNRSKIGPFCEWQSVGFPEWSRVGEIFFEPFKFIWKRNLRLHSTSVLLATALWCRLVPHGNKVK